MTSPEFDTNMRTAFNYYPLKYTRWIIVISKMIIIRMYNGVLDKLPGDIDTCRACACHAL